jgi:hypothetical protein
MELPTDYHEITRMLPSGVAAQRTYAHAMIDAVPDGQMTLFLKLSLATLIMVQHEHEPACAKPDPAA